jgi:hypothetical protein
MGEIFFQHEQAARAAQHEEYEMTIAEDSQHKIDAYLGQLRKRLRGLRDEDVQEIVEELRSHILDKALVAGNVTAAGVDSAVTALGSPDDLAGQYMTDDLLARAQVSGSLLLILRSLFRWASLSVAGFFILIGSLLGYFLGIVLGWAAILKPLHPHTAGLWVIPKPGGDYELSLHIAGFGSAPPGAHEVLGWWIIPLGLIVGLGLFFVTLRLDLWCIGRFRQSRSLASKGMNR